MSEPDMLEFYIMHRLENLPGRGRFLSVEQEDGSMIDVQEIPVGEWEAFIRQVRAEAWDEGASAFQAAAIDPNASITNPYKKDDR